MSAPTGYRMIAIAILTTIRDDLIDGDFAQELRPLVPGACGRFEIHVDPSAVFVPMSEEEPGTNYGPCPTCDEASVVEDGCCIHCGTPRGI